MPGSRRYFWMLTSCSTYALVAEELLLRGASTAIAKINLGDLSLSLSLFIFACKFLSFFLFATRAAGSREVLTERQEQHD